MFKFVWGRLALLSSASWLNVVMLLFSCLRAVLCFLALCSRLLILFFERRVVASLCIFANVLRMSSGIRVSGVSRVSFLFLLIFS